MLVCSKVDTQPREALVGAHRQREEEGVLWLRIKDMRKHFEGNML